MFTNDSGYFPAPKEYASRTALILRDNSTCLKILAFIHAAKECEKLCSCFGKSQMVTQVAHMNLYVNKRKM